MHIGSATLTMSYDRTGAPFSVTYNGTTYYYATNLQGDVTAILNRNGEAVVTYTYDAWGKLLTTSGSMASTLGVHNPLRYRGYVYDPETGLYYLQSRYYDPELGRFINADAFTSTGQGILGNNMFAYCGNNPVNLVDPSGWAPEYAGYPEYEWIWDFGWWLIEETEKEEEKIENGEVTYCSNGTGKGAHIENSYLIMLPWVMVEFIDDNKGDDIQGSTAGVAFEWVVHNVAHAIGKTLGVESFENKGMHVDVGNTIYADTRSNVLESVFSGCMKALYTITNPVSAVGDIFVSLKG